MAERGNGGIIGPANVPTTLKASGLWTLEEQYLAQANNNWPNNLVQRSLRFNSADSAYLTRTFSTGGTSRTTCTFSAWVKRGTLGAAQRIIDSYNGTGSSTAAIFNASDQLLIGFGGTGQPEIVTTAVYRDPSAWYHVLVVFDSTQATSTDRMKLFVNGVQVTAFSSATYPAQNAQHSWMYAGSQNRIGTDWSVSGPYFNGYMTEVNFIDGQALTPSSFGITNPDTGVWQPKAYTGTYGTNGFYLNFSDNSNTTATTLGKDYSGNGNNWTPNNFSVSAGAGNDSLVDVPTNWGTDTGVGGTVRGNYCTWNPLDNGGITLANGNIDASRTTGSWTGLRAGFGVSQGKWYWEFTTTSNVDSVNGPMLGLMTSRASISNYPGSDANGYGYLALSGDKFNSGASSAYGAGWGNGNVIGIAFDADAGTLTFYKNGVSQGTAFTGLTSGPYFPALGLYGATLASGSINFGQRPFAYTAPSGFKALCTQNLPTPTIGATAATQAGKYFNAVTWTGDGSSSRSITGVGFQPDFTWLKTRSNPNQSHHFVDAVRGYGTSAMRTLFSNQTDAEESSNAAGTLFYGNIQSLNSDGFTVAAGNTGADQVNKSSWTYVAWNWKANGAGVTNTSGSVTSTVSANTTSGFSVVTFTAQSSGTATVGHGLGTAPKMLIFKSRTSGTDNWATYHASLGSGQIIYLNLTNSTAGSGVPWNSTSPTSSVFTLGTGFAGLGNMVAYCFAEVPGFSKFGSYTGNGSTDGPFVYCGFRPKYVMFKRTDTTGSWIVYDTTRDTINVAGKELLPNASNAEATYSILDFLSNGFKLRIGVDAPAVNASGGTYIFAAFAEAPQKFALAR